MLKFTTLLSPAGISIRVLHSNQDAAWNGLKSNEVTQRMSEVKYEGDTPLGTKLWRKILKPMILDKAERGELKKPVMVIVITDGEVRKLRFLHVLLLS